MPTSLPLIFASLASFHGNMWVTIFDWMPIEQLVLLAHLSPEMRSLVQAYMRLKWAETLRRFVRDVEGFRDCLHVMQAVVSGSLALEFLVSSVLSWMANDMDIYCPDGHGQFIARYLQRNEGYEITRGGEGRRRDGRNRRRSNYSTSNRSGIQEVIQLRRADGREIDIIVSCQRSALYPIAFFWTTLLMNYVSADSFCVAYLATTFCNYGCLINSSSHRFMEVYLKYVARGFTLKPFYSLDPEYVLNPYGDVLPDCQDNAYCPNFPRHFGDEWCIQLVFDEQEAWHNAVDRWTPSWICGGSVCRFCGRSSPPELVLLRSLP